MRASAQSVVVSGFSRTGAAARESHGTWCERMSVDATVTFDQSRLIGPAKAGPYDLKRAFSSDQG
jgi:hypothetical protein